MKRLQIILLSLLFVYLLGFALLYFAQEQFIFLDDDLPDDYTYEFQGRFEEVNLQNGNAKLNGLHFKADSAKGIIVYFHGNQGNLTRWGAVVQPFVRMGFDVLVMDYRGYGKSTGKRSQKALMEDAALFYKYAHSLFSEDQITLFGRSLGTGLASYLAGRNKPKRLILETPYYSMASVGQKLYPIYPVSLALKFNLKSHQYLETASCPVFIFHGTEDRVVAYKQGVRLHESMPKGQSHLITIEGGRHKNLAEFEGYWEGVSKIFKGD